MSHKNITFSIPEDLRDRLYAHVNKRGMSRFISNAINKALEEERLKKEQELDKAYEAANSDFDRLETLQEWDVLDDISEWNDENEDWDWLRNLKEKR